MITKNRVAVVTGGGTGIGKAIAMRLAREGAIVVITGRREDVLQKTIVEIQQINSKSVAIVSDVSDESSIKATIAQVINTYGKIDILVNNAGIALQTDAITATQEDWDKVINTDLKGSWLMAKHTLPYMLKQEYGRIINISSIAGILGMNACLAYGAAKGGIINMTKVLAVDYTAKGITVNAIAPGYIDTDMTAPYLQSKEAVQAILDQQLVKRIGKPEDIAACAIYLASEEASYITGQTIVVDGGYSVK